MRSKPSSGATEHTSRVSLKETLHITKLYLVTRGVRKQQQKERVRPKLFIQLFGECCAPKNLLREKRMNVKVAQYGVAHLLLLEPIVYATSS